MTSSTHPLIDKVNQCFPAVLWKDVHLLLAVSGGADSVALLRAFCDLKAQNDGQGKIRVVHVNHQLRGDDSAADAQWCRSLCEQLQVPITVCNADSSGRAAQDCDGLEAAARAERYRLLQQQAEATGARYVATAHTQDDQIETVLMRILRGSGLRGLSGIPKARPLTPSVTLIRPLLNCSREAVEAYLKKLDQPYCTDRSNFSDHFTRNRVRHELLPLLREQFNADVGSSLLRLAIQAKQTQELMEQLAQSVLSKCELQLQPNELSLLVSPLLGESSVIVCETLRLAWRAAGLPEQDMTYEWWHRLETNCKQSEVLNLPGNIRAGVVNGRLTLKRH